MGGALTPDLSGRRKSSILLNVPSPQYHRGRRTSLVPLAQTPTPMVTPQPPYQTELDPKLYPPPAAATAMSLPGGTVDLLVYRGRKCESCGGGGGGGCDRMCQVRHISISQAAKRASASAVSGRLFLCTPARERAHHPLPSLFIPQFSFSLPQKNPPIKNQHHG